MSLCGRTQAGDAERDEVYVWWGKIRSPNRVMLEEKPVVQKAVRMAFPHDHPWLLGALPHCLRRITGIRNPSF